METHNSTSGLLGDLTVLELGQHVAGPYCGRLLAGLGAEVIKVEPPAGEPGRSVGPFKDGDPHPEKSARFLHLNAGKKSVTLDLRSRTGRDLFLRLLDQADILVENLGPGRLAALGLDYPVLADRRPELIAVAISWFGHSGPYRDYRASELTAFALSGFAYLTGTPDREPLRPGFNAAQCQGGVHAATGAMGALMLRDAAGIGQLVDVAIVEAACFAHGALAPYLNLGQVYKRAGTRNLNFNPRYHYPSVTLPCKDGHVHVHFAPADPQLLAVLMEEPRLEDPRLWEEPMGHADEFDALCLPWLSRYDKWEATRRAQELRHPFCEVLSVGELFADPQLQARGMFVELDHPTAGPVAHVGPAVRPEAEPWRTARAPLLGEHNLEVFCGRLGLSREELVRLRELGVV